MKYSYYIKSLCSENSDISKPFIFTRANEILTFLCDAENVTIVNDSPTIFRMARLASAISLVENEIPAKNILPDMVDITFSRDTMEFSKGYMAMHSENQKKCIQYYKNAALGRMLKHFPVNHNSIEEDL